MSGICAEWKATMVGESRAEVCSAKDLALLNIKIKFYIEIAEIKHIPLIAMESWSPWALPNYVKVDSAYSKYRVPWLPVNVPISRPFTG